MIEDVAAARLTAPVPSRNRHSQGEFLHMKRWSTVMSADVKAMLARPDIGWFVFGSMICSVSLVVRSLNERSRYFDAERFASTMLWEGLPVNLVLYPAALALVCRPLCAAFDGRLGRASNWLGSKSAALTRKVLDGMSGVVLGVTAVQILHDVGYGEFHRLTWIPIAYVLACLVSVRAIVGGAWQVTWHVSTDAESCLLAWTSVVCSCLVASGLVAEFSL